MKGFVTFNSLQDDMYLHQAGGMKDVVMMIGEMIVDHLVVMMAAGGAEMKEGVDQRMTVVATRVGMKMAGAVMIEEMLPQEGINKRGKWMKKDLKQFAPDVKYLCNFQ